MADNLSIARSLYDGWNARAFDELAELTTEDAELLVVGTGDVFRGQDGSRQWNQHWAEAFPDGRVTVDNIVGSGDTVVVEYTGRGTHTGTLAAPMGDIPATGKSMTLRLCDVIELRDGKVFRQRIYFDSASMMAQLGLMSGQPATATS